MILGTLNVRPSERTRLTGSAGNRRTPAVNSFLSPPRCVVDPKTERDRGGMRQDPCRTCEGGFRALAALRWVVDSKVFAYDPRFSTRPVVPLRRPMGRAEQMGVISELLGNLSDGYAFIWRCPLQGLNALVSHCAPLGFTRREWRVRLPVWDTGEPSAEQRSHSK